ncbi:MAG: hypothetical protein IT303_11890 [Dehalococcoidia bacterium]|nr:hypothetical protein [Dehalococcoidia bacterium]
MRDQSPDLTVQVVQSRAAPRPHAHVMTGPRHPWLFAAWMAASTAIAVVAGLTLGLLAVLEVSIGGDRWTQAVQAHGRLQLFGFVATFVTALAFEFLVRLNQRAAFPARIRLGVPAVIAAGSLLLAAGQTWYDSVGFLAPAGGVIVAGGAAVFTVAVWRVAPPFPLSANPQPLFPRAGAAWLLVAAVFAASGAFQAETGVVPLDTSRATVELFLRGFVMLFILGIALRAFVGHLGLQPMTPGRQIVVFALLNASLAAWLLAQGLGSLPELGWLARIADAGYALAILLFTVWMGVLRRLRHMAWTPAYGWMLPVAWLGALVYAALLAARAVAGDVSPGLYEDGALRHIFMLGFMVPLMAGMSDVVLARFATGRIPREKLLVVAFAVLIVAWPLRVVPALIEDAPGDAGRGLMGLAGVLTMVALAGLVVVAASVAKAHRAAVRPAVRHR